MAGWFAVSREVSRFRPASPEPGKAGRPRLPVLLACTLAATACLGTGCDRKPGPASAKASATAEVAPSPRPDRIVTPIQTARHMRELYAQSAVDALAVFIQPDQREAVLAQLAAIERLTTAYRSMNELLQERIGPGTASLVNADDLANLAGLFSPDVEIFDERIEGDYAWVTYSVAGRIPLDEAAFVRGAGRWRLRTEPPVPELTEQLGKLADVADRVAILVRSREMTVQQVQHELSIRQEPILRRIAEIEARNQPNN